MKTFLIILLLYPVFCQGQKCPAPRQQLREPLYNSISVCLQPNDLGSGLRYDRIFGVVGAYVSASHGTYQFIRSSTKFAVGAVYIKNYVFISTGGIFHINKGIIESEIFDKQALKKWGVEIGAGKLFNHFVVAFRYELFKSNVSIDIGYRF